MKAVIEAGSIQYVVEEGDLLEIEQVGEQKTLTFEPLMIIDDKGTKVGTPSPAGASVKVKVVEQRKLGPKVVIMKFQSKKRVHTKTGHRQPLSVVEITDIKTT